MASRQIRPKLYRIRTKNGGNFVVRAMNERAARRYIVEMLEGALESSAIHDDEAFRLGRDGVEVLDAIRAED